MIRCIQHQPTADFCGRGMWKWAGIVFVGAMVLAAPSVSLAADWLAPASDQAVSAPWVKDIAAQLERGPYREILMNASGGPPHPVVVRYLNNAAQAVQAGNMVLAQSYVEQTIGIFESGVFRGYYSRSEIEPITTLIHERAEAAMKGEKIPLAQEQERWTGYTHDRPLGLVGEGDRAKNEPASQDR